MSSYDESGQNETLAKSHDNTRSSKRRRIALACLDCRRRKLKCDRLFPACSRCQRGGQASYCTYDADAVEAIVTDGSYQLPRVNNDALDGHREPEVPGASNNLISPTSFVHHHALDTDESALARLRAHVYRLENRIIGLEKTAHAPQEHHGSPRTNSDSTRRPGTHDARTAEQDEKESMMFRGKSFRTQFYGASHHTSYLSHLPKLRGFMEEMVTQHSEMGRVEKELKGTKVQGSENTDIEKEGKVLAQFLPQKETIDQLVHIYIETFESTYRVLHLPSFYKEYYQCLDAPDRGRPVFIALLLVMMATTCCMKSGKQSMLRGDSSLDRENAAHWIQAAETWLELQSHKHVSPMTFQLRVVIFIAQQVNAIKRKRLYTASGTLARLAISAGLHRDSEIVNLRHGSLGKRRVTLFDQELRRRIWSTVSELEMQVSIDRGMPSTMRDLIVDCGPPLNLDDDEFTPLMDELVVPKPTFEYTRSSFQYINHNTFALRQELVSLINGSCPRMPYEELLQYDRKIMQALEDIPPWHNEDHGAQISRTLLQIQMHHLQLLIHQPYVLQASQSKRYEYSAVVHLRAAMSIIDLHQRLITIGSNVFSVMRSDILTAVLNICYSSSISGPDVDRKLHAWSGMIGVTDTIPYLENALSMLENKITRLGVGIQEYYCTCAVIGLQRKQSASASPEITHEYEAADRVSKLIQKMLSLQDNFSAAATLASLPNMPVAPVNGMSVASGINGQSSMMSAVPSSALVENTGLLEEFDHDLEGFDVTGWDLDAFFNF